MSFSDVPFIAKDFKDSATTVRRRIARTDQDKTNVVGTTDEHTLQAPLPVDFSTSETKIRYLERLLDRHETYDAVLYALSLEGLTLDDHEYVMELAGFALDNLDPTIPQAIKKQLSYALSAPQFENDLSLHLVA